MHAASYILKQIDHDRVLNFGKQEIILIAQQSGLRLGKKNGNTCGHRDVNGGGGEL
jgi:hypothetical protein